MDKSPCRVCGSENTEYYSKARISPSKRTAVMFKCSDCGVVFAGGDYPLKEETRFYEEEYFDLEPEDYWFINRRNIFSHVLDKLDAIRAGERGKLLDIGCGPGYFMNMARDRGYSVHGCEISNAAFDYAVNSLKLNVFKGEIQNAGFEDGFFDVITMWNVLDQMANPKEALSACVRFLKPGGVLMLRVTNLDFQKHVHGFAGKTALKNLKNINEAMVLHIYSFNRDAIRRVLRIFGFKDARVFPSPIGSESRGLKEIFGKTGGMAVKLIAEAFGYFIYYVTLKKVVLTPSLIAYARK
jgi:SAM-dependent methyltransferase